MRKLFLIGGAAALIAVPGAALADSPRDPRFDLKPLRGQTDRPRPLRLRVGEYRVILQIYHDLEEIRVARVGHRSTVYRHLE